MNTHIARSAALLIGAAVLAIGSTACVTVPIPTAETYTPLATATFPPTQVVLLAPTQTPVPTLVPTSSPTLAATPTATTPLQTTGQVATITATVGVTPLQTAPAATATVTRTSTPLQTAQAATRVAGALANLTRTPTAAATARPTSTRAPVPSPGMMTVKLFFVALNDNGESGRMIGCEDSVVAVDRAIPETSAPLTAALKELLSIRTQYYGQSGLYNALYQSNLKVGGVSITSGTAIINLTGTYALGGVCDGPRFVAQIQETALQFSTVREVVVFINGKPIDSILSGKG